MSGPIQDQLAGYYGFVRARERLFVFLSFWGLSRGRITPKLKPKILS